LKITEIEIFRVKPRWIFCKISTDAGISGWGEMISGTKTETVVAVINVESKITTIRNFFTLIPKDLASSESRDKRFNFHLNRKKPKIQGIIIIEQITRSL